METGAIPTMPVTDMIVFEHSKIKKLYEAYKSASSPEQQQQLCWEIIWEDMSVHTYKEMVVWPALRKLLGDGPADHCAQMCTKKLQLFAELDKMSILDKSFEAKFEEAMKLVMQSIEEEENDVLPKFLAKVDDSMLQELGVLFDTATASAPTRPHPDAPSDAPGLMKAAPKLRSEDLKQDMERFGGQAHLSAATM